MGKEGMWIETIFVRENEKRRERGRGHYSLNITNTLVNYCISHAKLVLLPMEVDISMTILSHIFNCNCFDVLLIFLISYLVLYLELNISICL